jgi:hypothetical protein
LISVYAKFNIITIVLQKYYTTMSASPINVTNIVAEEEVIVVETPKKRVVKRAPGAPRKKKEVTGTMVSLAVPVPIELVSTDSEEDEASTVTADEEAKSSSETETETTEKPKKKRQPKKKAEAEKTEEPVVVESDTTTQVSDTEKPKKKRAYKPRAKKAAEDGPDKRSGAIDAVNKLLDGVDPLQCEPAPKKSGRKAKEVPIVPLDHMSLTQRINKLARKMNKHVKAIKEARVIKEEEKDKVDYAEMEKMYMHHLVSMMSACLEERQMMGRIIEATNN